MGTFAFEDYFTGDPPYGNSLRVVNEHADRENSSAQLEFICAWGDRLEIAQQIIGGLLYGNGGSASYSTPMEYPFGSGIFATSCDMEPLGDHDDSGYISSKMTVNFAAFKVFDPYETDGIKICQITSTVNGEGLALPTGTDCQYKWESDGQQLTDADIAPQLTFPYVELSVKVLFASQPLIQTCSDIVGNINSDTLTIDPNNEFDEGTVLFLGAQIDQVVNVQGNLCWQREIKLGVRDNAGLGWNAVWRPGKGTQAGGWDYIVDKDGKYLYQKADLNVLFGINET